MSTVNPSLNAKRAHSLLDEWAFLMTRKIGVDRKTTGDLALYDISDLIGLADQIATALQLALTTKCFNCGNDPFAERDLKNERPK